MNTPTQPKTGKPILDALISASESFADQTAADAPEAPQRQGANFRWPIPTPQQHIQDLHDAATRFEDRAKRAEAQRDELLARLEVVAGAIRWAKKTYGPNKWIKHVTCDWSYVLEPIANTEKGAK